MVSASFTPVTTTTVTNYSQTSRFCYNGVGWESVGTNNTATNDFSASNIYDEDIYFSTGGTNMSGYPNNTEELASNITGTFGVSNWTFQCNATDNINGIVSANSSILQITAALVTYNSMIWSSYGLWSWGAVSGSTKEPCGAKTNWTWQVCTKGAGNQIPNGTKINWTWVSYT
jgi:hypothetical protein